MMTSDTPVAAAQGSLSSAGSPKRREHSGGLSLGVSIAA